MNTKNSNPNRIDWSVVTLYSSIDGTNALMPMARYKKG